MLSSLFAGLVATPLLGALAFAVTGQIQQAWVQKARLWIIPVAAVITLMLSAMLLVTPGEAVIGGWSPVSVMGAPLLIANAPIVAGIIFALACVEFARAIYGAGETRTSHVLHALTFGALAMAALGNNTLTLFIGVGLADLFATVSAVLWAQHRAARQDVMRTAVFQAGSLLMLGAALSVNLAAESSLYFPLLVVNERSVPLFAAALALRFAPAPLYPYAALNRASLVAGMVVLLRLAQLNLTPFPIPLAPLAVLGALVALTRAAATLTADIRTMGAQIGALMLALMPATTNDPALICAATSAWILGASLVEHPARAARTIGALSLFGVPPLLGYVAHVGVTGDLIAAGRIAVFVAWGGGFALLAYALARVVRGNVLERGWFERNWRSWLSWVTLAIPLLVGGMATNILGLPGFGELVASNGLLAWSVLVLALVAGIAAMAFEPRWAGRVRPVRDRLERLVSLRWLSGLFEGAFHRLGGPFRGVFIFLESDGTLLWAVIVVLIAVLIARPGGP